MKIFLVAVLLSMLVQSGSAQDRMFLLRSELTESLPEVRQNIQQPISAEKRSPATAVLYSLILPGMGELYADAFDDGKYSLIAEGGLWITYLSMRQYGDWIQTDARNFAALHAGAQINGKDDQFFVNVGNFADTYEYNDKKLRDRELDRVYDENAGYSWKWDSEQSRREFRSMRVSSEKVLNNSQFVIAAVIVNRVVSAINAARLTRLYNKRSEDGLGSWRLESSLIETGQKIDGIRLSVVHRF